MTRERDEVRVDLAFFLTGAATSATAPVESAAAAAQSQYVFTDDDNNLPRYTYDDFFTLNLYKGNIYKTRNLRNRSMAQLYPDPERRRLRTLRVADDDPPELLAFLGSFLTLTRERDEVRVDLAFFLTGRLGVLCKLVGCLTGVAGGFGYHFRLDVVERGVLVVDVIVVHRHTRAQITINYKL